MSETTTALNDWDPIWAQQADEEYIRSVLKSSAAQIESFLVSDDQTEEETLALLGRRLSSEIDTTTYDVVLDALRALLGVDGANVVHWYTVGNGADTGLLEEVAPPRVAFFVRRIAAAHLPEFRSAFALWKEVPEDWRTIHRDVYFDYINQRMVVRHRIIKINGEEMIVEGNANSLLDLTRSLMTSLGLIGTRDAFGDREIAAFLEEADKVIAILRPQEPSGNGDVAVADFGQPAET
ncbi:MAG TPA: hypothetical protein VGQ15_15200 [Gaiellaceae bacterium]|jgi:hypothetical protein|nr:hypothetical protein [Gaiellaceae bacterium]